MRFVTALLYWIFSLCLSAYYIHLNWHHQKELYWAMIALLNQKTTVFLSINMLVSTYVLFVVSVHRYFFQSTREGERYVAEVSNSRTSSSSLSTN